MQSRYTAKREVSFVSEAATNLSFIEVGQFQEVREASPNTIIQSTNSKKIIVALTTWSLVKLESTHAIVYHEISRFNEWTVDKSTNYPIPWLILVYPLIP